MKRITSISMCLEADINREWTLMYNDGSYERFYAYEESPRRNSDDSYVHTTDPKLHKFLEDLSEKMYAILMIDEDEAIRIEDLTPNGDFTSKTKIYRGDEY